MANPQTISGGRALKGSIRLPGDKSISHRAAMLLALAEGNSTITNYADGEDCKSTLSCLMQLGVSISLNGSSVNIAGKGLKGFKSPSEPLDCGNSGTTMRLLSGILSGAGANAVLTGDASLISRPMKRIVDPLRQMGADIQATNGTAPISIKNAGGLSGIEYELPVASAQVKSCVLFAGINSLGPVKTISPATGLKIPSSRDHSERMLRFLGASIEESYLSDEGLYRHLVTLEPPKQLAARDISIPGDISTAAFFLVAAAGLKGSDLTLKDVGLNTSRRSIIEVMKDCGIRISVANERDLCNEPRGDVRVSWDGECELIKDKLIISGEKTAGLIDEIPILAVLGTLLPGGLEVRDASELRLKESDRIDAIVSNLKRLGAIVNEHDDGFEVRKSGLSGAEIDTFGDHRIAMAFAVAGLFAKGETTINDADCAAVSFPSFFDKLSQLQNA